jgi:hypothetical protein
VCSGCVAGAMSDDGDEVEGPLQVSARLRIAFWMRFSACRLAHSSGSVLLRLYVLTACLYCANAL